MLSAAARGLELPHGAREFLASREPPVGVLGGPASPFARASRRSRRRRPARGGQGAPGARQRDSRPALRSRRRGAPARRRATRIRPRRPRVPSTSGPSGSTRRPAPARSRSGSSTAAPGGKQARRISGNPIRASSASEHQVAGRDDLGAPAETRPGDGGERDGRRFATSASRTRRIAASILSIAAGSGACAATSTPAEKARGRPRQDEKTRRRSGFDRFARARRGRAGRGR